MAALLLAVGSVVFVVARQPASADGSWLSSDLSGAVLLQLTDVDGQLAGSAQTWRTDDALGPLGTSESLTLTGLRSDDSLSITLNGPLGTQLTWTGVIDGEELTLQIASDGGGLDTAVFRRSTVVAFNAAVEAGQRSAGERQAAAQQQEAAMSEQERLDEAAGDAALAEQRVADDLERLDQAVGYLEGIDLQPQIDEMDRRLQAMRGQLDRVLATPECVAQSDAVVALGDGLVALGDADVAFGDARLAVDEAIGRADAVIVDLDKHLRDLESAIAASGTSAPPTTITRAEVTQRSDAAQSSIDATAMRSGDVDEVAADLLEDGEALFDQGEASIRSCVAEAPGAPAAPRPPEPSDAPDAPQGP